MNIGKSHPKEFSNWSHPTSNSIETQVELDNCKLNTTHSSSSSTTPINQCDSDDNAAEKYRKSIVYLKRKYTLFLQFSDEHF